MWNTLKFNLFFSFAKICVETYWTDQNKEKVEWVYLHIKKKGKNGAYINVRLDIWKDPEAHSAVYSLQQQILLQTDLLTKVKVKRLSGIKLPFCLLNGWYSRQLPYSSFPDSFVHILCTHEWQYYQCQKVKKEEKDIDERNINHINDCIYRDSRK